ncbi:response regulator [Sphingomonas sp. R647]|jgi:two-component system response regulator FixJ|uniref:response regulator transcription factor n=1 Tax=unclassified Sphingomonas TaxID=196159 RepID=UPI0010EC31F7|nr:MULTISPECIES: response regulator [unclassified Sphingomonas]MCA1199001.1 response regulator [Sphingomonas sp. R647]RYD67077.1 MAG: response regulator [Sphingomonadales bacterium]HEV7289550.1 response regulator [Sphingomonas sp.]
MQSVYIVDDDQAVRQSLHGLLSERPNLVIRVFASGDAFLDNIEASDGGVLLLDFQMPGRNGIDVMRELQERSAKFLTIMLTGQGDISLAVQAMKAGATDFLEKPYDPHHLLNLLDQAFARFSETSGIAERREQARERIARLSPREHEVLMGLIEGRPNKVIAHQLDLSPRTVEIYRANMMEKLDVSSLSEALRLAYAAEVAAPV